MRTRNQIVSGIRDAMRQSRVKAWTQKMARLEAIHRQIGPQLEALRAASDDAPDSPLHQLGTR